MPGQEKSGWDKADVILKPVGGFLTAVAIVLLGFMTSSYLAKRQAGEQRLLAERQLIEAKTQIYAQLMSSREQADSSLRKDMFNSIIQTFLTSNFAGLEGKKSSGLEEKVLALELLVYNFHEALDLGPLFKHVQSEVIDTKAEEYQKRLERIASEVTDKQIAVLEEAGGKLDGTIDLEELNKKPEGIKVIEGTLPSHPIGTDGSKQALRRRDFKVEALYADQKRNEIRINLKVRTPNEDGDEEILQSSVFWVGFFDFPMIDNTRLSDGERCAIVLRKLKPPSAEITLVYFPGSRASLKEKPYYNEVINDLLRVRTPP